MTVSVIAAVRREGSGAETVRRGGIRESVAEAPAFARGRGDPGVRAGAGGVQSVGAGGAGAAGW